MRRNKILRQEIQNLKQDFTSQIEELQEITSIAMNHGLLTKIKDMRKDYEAKITALKKENEALYNEKGM